MGARVRAAARGCSRCSSRRCASSCSSSPSVAAAPARRRGAHAAGARSLRAGVPHARRRGLGAGPGRRARAPADPPRVRVQRQERRPGDDAARADLRAVATTCRRSGWSRRSPRAASRACRSTRSRSTTSAASSTRRTSCAVAAGQPLGRPLGELLHEPLFVPRTTPVKRLFLTFKQKKVHMAIVVSEYGKVLGLVTMDDLLAQIFGVLRDERAELQQLDPPGARARRRRRRAARRRRARHRRRPVPARAARRGDRRGPSTHAGRRVRRGRRDRPVPRSQPDSATACSIRRRRRRARPIHDVDEVTPPAIDVDELVARARAKDEAARDDDADARSSCSSAACSCRRSSSAPRSRCPRAIATALRTRAAGGGRRAARAERMLAVPQVTLATTLVGANLATLVAVLVLGARARRIAARRRCGRR